MRFIILFVVFISFFGTSCYRMPSDNEVSVVPNTNNPQLINSGATPSWLPSPQM